MSSSLCFTVHLTLGLCGFPEAPQSRSGGRRFSPTWLYVDRGVWTGLVVALPRPLKRRGLESLQKTTGA
ncbi:hypothetical protein VULLAG_LOCUS2610 [Vulpes lagopus]